MSDDPYDLVAQIDHLRAENERLRAALGSECREIVQSSVEVGWPLGTDWLSVADRAWTAGEESVRASLRRTLDTADGEGWRCPATGPHEPHEWRVTPEFSRHCTGISDNKNGDDPDLDEAGGGDSHE